jgi:release factor glutamine methyltransferase
MAAETQSPAGDAGSTTPAPTIEALLRAGVRLLEESSGSPRLDAELLLAHALGCDRAGLFARRSERVAAGADVAFRTSLRERRSGRPVAQLTGTREFWSLALVVTPNVLVPRPETELLVERALARLAGAARLLDLGTGSGAVALAIASERPDCDVLATDASAAALEVARGNARRLALARVRFAEGDWYGAVGAAQFDVIVANPPYLSEAEVVAAGAELAFEPRLALTPGQDALAALRVIVTNASEHLASGGWLIVEHGAQQGELVRALMTAAELAGVATSTDLAGLPRVTEGRRPG